MVAQVDKPGDCGRRIRFAVTLLLNSHICTKGCFDIRIIFLS